MPFFYGKFMALTDPNTPEGMALQGNLLRPLEGDEMQPVQLAGLGKSISRVLSGDRSGVLGKSSDRLNELRAGGDTAIDSDVVVDAPAETTDVAPTTYPPEYQNELNTMRRQYEGKGVKIKPNQTDAEAVQAGIKEPSQVDDDGLLSDFRAVGSRGDEKIPDEGRILSTIDSISTQFRDEFNEATRGEMGLQAQRDLADLVGVDEKQLARNILGRQRGNVIIQDGSGLAETMVASRDLLVKEIKKLDELAWAAENGTDEQALAFRAQLELVGQLQAQIKGAQTEIARALGSFRVPARGGSTDHPLARQDLTTMLEDFGGSGDVRDMAKMYNQAGSMADRAAVARKSGLFRKSADAFYEAWINILLSSPVTHTKNVVGAFLTTAAHVPEMYMAAGVGSARRSMGGEGGITLGEANASMFGGLMAIREAWGAAATGMASGQKVIAGTKIDGALGKRQINSFSAEAFEVSNPVVGKAVDYLGHVMTLGRAPTKLLEFEDTYFKVVAQRMSLYEQAMRSGRGKGLDGDDLAEHIAQFVHEPPASALKQADAHAKYVTLQTDLDAVGKNISGLRKIPGMRYFLPFFKTPYNSFKYAVIDRGPIGIFYGEGKAAIRRSRAPGASKADKVAGDMALARLAAGNATGALIFSYAMEGNITGKGPAEPGLRAAMVRSGWQPYSIKIGNKYYSYQSAEPFSTTIGAAADAAEAMFYGGLSAEDEYDVYAAVAATIGNQITNKTFMQGMSNLVKTLNDPQRYGESTADSFIRSITPRVAAQAKKMADPLLRATNDKIDLFRSQIPGLSSDLPARKNLWGQSIYVSEAFGPDIVSPIYRSVYGPNEMDSDPDRAKQAFELDEEFIEIGWGPRMHPKNFNANLDFGPKGVARFHEYAGSRSIDQLSAVVGSNQYQRLKVAAMSGNKLAKEKAILMLRGGLLTAREAARNDMLKDPDFGPQLKDALKRQNKEMKDNVSKMKAAMQ